jgi:hypothetical protein
MRLYYFTGTNFALSNLALRRLKVSRFHDLNDPFELLAVDIGEREQRASIRAARDRLNDAKGLICFCRSWKNPLVWGHYAEKHTGICLGFDVEDSRVEPVIYASRPMKIRTDPKTGEPKLTVANVSRLQRTKFRDWKYEAEMRYFVYLEEVVAESGLYFQSFCPDIVLREVILGPRCALPIAGIRALVRPFKPTVSVVKARIAYRSFNVVEDRVATHRQKAG